MKKGKKWIVGACTLAGGALSSMAAQDWTTIGTAVTADVTAAMPVALGIGGTIIGAVIGWRVIKRVSG